MSLKRSPLTNRQRHEEAFTILGESQTDKALRRGVFHSVPDLIAKIEEYLTAHNDDPKPFVWTATADEILAKVARGRVALEAVNQ